MTVARRIATVCAAAAAAFLLAVPVAAQEYPSRTVKIIVPFGAGGDIEVTFSAPMVPDSMKGKSVPAATVLEIKPALKADLVWQSSRSASLTIGESVPLGVAYRISLRRDVKDAAGKPVIPGPPVTVNSPAFVIEQHQPRWFFTTGADARQRGPRFDVRQSAGPRTRPSPHRAPAARRSPLSPASSRAPPTSARRRAYRRSAPSP